MPITDDILLATEEIETPKSFILWAVLAAISAVIRKNLWFEKHAYRVYPNIYVLLVAAAALRKGFAITVCKRLVKSIPGMLTISGQNSIQGIIKVLRETQSNEDGSIMRMKAQALVASGELANLLIDDPQAHTILTELYNTHENEEEWTKTLKGTGKETLIEPCLTLIAASNQRLLMESIPKAAYEGGLIGRTMVILEHSRRCVNSLIDEPENMIDWEKAQAELEMIATLRGPFVFEPAARKLYDDWYKSFDIERMDDKTGTAGRMQDHILKIAMLLSVTRRVELVLTEREINEAMDLCMLSTSSIKKVTAGAGTAQLAAQTGIVLRELLSAPDRRVRKTRLLRKHYGDFDAQDLGRIMETLNAAGAIDVRSETFDGEQDTVYILKEVVATAYEKIERGA